MNTLTAAKKPVKSSLPEEKPQGFVSTVGVLIGLAVFWIVLVDIIQYCYQHFIPKK